MSTCTRVWFWAPAMLGVMILAGCRNSPQMTEFTPRYVSFPQDVGYVPVILVRLVLEDAVTDGQYHPSRYDSNEWTIRCRVKVKVENVLQGEVTGTEVNIYFFVAAVTHGSGVRYSFRKGDRDIFFLQRDYGELRLISDTFSNVSLVKVLSGAHPSFRRDPSRPVWDCITDLLLTRGVGVDDRQMTKAIDANGVGREHTESELIKKLDQLAREETPAVRERACFYLQLLKHPCPEPNRNLSDQ